MRPDFVHRARGVRNTVRVVVGRSMRSAREGCDLSQEDLAWLMSQAGLRWDQGTVSLVERGRRKLTAEEVSVLAFVLNVRVSDIIPEVEPRSA